MPKTSVTMAVRKDPFSTPADAEVWAQQQRITTTCAICGASIEALVPDAVAWFAQHRKTEHPNQPTRTPVRRGRPR
jgi:hypothetical protein